MPRKTQMSLVQTCKVPPCQRGSQRVSVSSNANDATSLSSRSLASCQNVPIMLLATQRWPQMISRNSCSCDPVLVVVTLLLAKCATGWPCSMLVIASGSSYCHGNSSWVLTGWLCTVVLVLVLACPWTGP